MANWCYNTVMFDGDERTMGKIESLFAELMQWEAKDNEGQLPDFVSEQDGYMFSLNWEDGTLYYETKWSPNIGVIKTIADRFGAEFTHEYEEAGMGIFGRATYVAGVLTELDLDDTDFDQYDLDEMTGMYTFEGREYESSYEILETLLDRKQRQLLTNKTTGNETNR